MRAPVWITESEVVSLIDLGEAIQAVEHGFQAESAGEAQNLLKTHVAIPGGSLHSIGGALVVDDVVGVKSWAHTPGGATPLLTMWRISDGSLLAVIEAFALGQYRTAAVAGAATHALAAPNATRLTILGSGHQALTQVAAVAAVRALTHVTVWSPNAERRTRFAGTITDALGLDASAADSVEQACAGADVITLVTRATSPFLSADDVPSGAHVNAMGAITPERAEFEPSLLKRCDVVAADSVPAARALSRELAEFYGDGHGDGWDEVIPLSTLVGAGERRPDGADVTLFKSMGVGVADVAIGLFVYEQAVLNRIGAPLAIPSPSRPRLRSNLRRAGVGYV